MAVAAPENSYALHVAAYVERIKKQIEKKQLFSVFKSHVKLFREQTAGDSEEFRNDVITEYIAIIKDACLEVLKCSHCHHPFHFKHYQNPGCTHESIHAIELTCDQCGDNFTLAEDSEQVSYFNWNVLREVDHLRGRSRGFTVKACLGGLLKPALLYVYEGDKRPILWIDAYQITKAEAVQPLWEYAKAMVKQLKEGGVSEEGCILLEGETLYSLTALTDGDVLQVV